MIIVGLSSLVLAATLGTHGITPAQISALGDHDSPLLNDVDPGDTSTEFIWALLSPLVGSGTTDVTDLGGYALVGAADGTWTQDYRFLAMPATGAPVVDESQIVTQVGATGVAPRITQQPTGLSLLEGQTAAFAVVATGDDSIAYQWKRNGVAISGATSPGYSKTAQLADNGAAFTVDVSTDAGGHVLSNAAVLLVAPAAAPARRPRRLYVAADVRRMVWS